MGNCEPSLIQTENCPEYMNNPPKGTKECTLSRRESWVRFGKDLLSEIYYVKTMTTGH